MPRCCFNTQKATPSAAISHQLRISRPSLYKCIDRALAAGVEVALKDKYHRPKTPVIRPEAKAWGGRFYWFLPPSLVFTRLTSSLSAQSVLD